MDLCHLRQVREASNGDTSDGSPGYIYTARTSDLTSRNGGWSRMDTLKYNELYKKLKEDRLVDNGAFDSEYMMHWVEKTRGKRKRRCDNGSQLQSLTVSDDLEDLLGALDSHNGGTAAANFATV
jgi:hypothetical protein